MSARPSAAFLRLISSSILSQGVLSAGNFLVGLLLIRRSPHAQYGLYVLILTGVQLMTQMQAAFIQPALIRCIATQQLEGRRDFVGGAFREQRRHLLMLAAGASLLLFILWVSKVVATQIVPVGIAALVAIFFTLHREYFRLVLISYRLPLQALKADVFYMVLLTGGVFLSTLTPYPAILAAMSLAIAGAFGGWLLSRMAWQHEGWVLTGSPRIISELAPLGTWAVIGAAIHWTFSQGFIYIVAGSLGVTAVASISATRLLLMPVNLMSAGLGSMTFPTVSHWLQQYPVGDVFKRLSMLAGGIAGLALIYILAMWFDRDWIFTNIIKASFPHRDTLVMLWSGVFLLMAMRDQMMYLPGARGQFRIMAWLTLVTAILSLLTCYFCMQLFGVMGALMGVLAGEAFNILGFLTLSIREIVRSRSEPTPVPAQ